MPKEKIRARFFAGLKMVALFKEGVTSCPMGIIAIAVNIPISHCGVIYSASGGSTSLCDFQNDAKLANRPVPKDYYWTKVRFSAEEVDQFAALIELVLEQPPPPYSFVYLSSAIDIAGTIRQGAGFTCSTFVVALFEALRFPFIDVSTWQSRPGDDDAFRAEFMGRNFFGPGVMPTISQAAATRLMGEQMDFRIKPREVCGAATVEKYPVAFKQAVRAGERVAATIAKGEGGRGTT